jgi:hypothetical protein
MRGVELEYFDSYNEGLEFKDKQLKGEGLFI